MATIIVDKFINEIGFRFTKESRTALEGVERGIKSLRKFALVAGVALGGLGLAMDRVAGSIDKQAKFARGIGVTFENMQELQFAAKKAGISVGELDGVMEQLATTAFSTIPGRYSGALQALGISAKDVNGKVKSSLQLFLEIGDQLREFSPAVARTFGKERFGFSPQLVQLLVQGSEKIVKTMKEAQDIGGVIPESVTKNVAEFFDDALLKVKTTLKALTETVLISFLPALSKMLLAYDKWVVLNEKVVASKMGAFIKGISEGFANFGKISIVVLNSFSNLVKTFINGEKSLTAIKSISIVVTASLLALSASFVAARLPLILFGITLERIAALAPDFKELFSKLQGFASLLIISSKDAGQFSSFIREDVAAINALIEAFERLVPFKEEFRLLKEDFKDLFGGVSFFGSAKGLSGGIDKAVNQLGLSGRGKNVIQSLVQQTEAGKTVSLGAKGLAASQNSTNNVTINVSGAGDPKAVAREVKGQMELSTAAQTANPGFNRPRVS